ncbi:M16 family metallopeptidase [Vaginella massiliensis]|uniref:M16 family metallopeptidase n=1 Tax=Vaginella massiliensis TaxID=1816680 RepID=UPI003752860F
MIENSTKTYSYESVANDPSKTRIYTLANGLTVYMSQNFDEPRIQTYIAVKTGSNNDPNDTTGLAHYFEHMMFKGNSDIGTLNWEKEKPILQRLAQLFEEHRNEKNTDRKAELYQEIDCLSFEASQYAISNEYDKLTSLIGANNVNAHTSYNETIYYNNIPKNELAKWTELESCRFADVALRLFHTELETVYEEYNRSQDHDGRLIFNAMMQGLFPNSNYGNQTVLGRPEDLKSPSMKAIYEYFNRYYVASNMAIILVGDLDFDKTIKLIDNTFGQFAKIEKPTQYIAKEPPIEQPVVKEVFSPSAERLQFAYRFGGYNSEDAVYIKLIDVMLNNSIAGLIDLNINQPQKAQAASSVTSFYREYGMHIFAGTPKDGQTLEDVQKLILHEIDRIKKGDFDEWLIEAVVNDYKKHRLNTIIKPASLGTWLYRSFINDIPWENVVNEIDSMAKISKADIVSFAQQRYTNPVTVYKRQGENKSLVYVKSPAITPIQINRKDESKFYQRFKQQKSEAIAPVLVDFDTEIVKESIQDVDFYYIPNRDNDLVNLYFITEMGKDHDRFLSLALGYLDYAGTSRYSAEELRKEFYRYGIDFRVRTQNERTFLYLSGLEENIEKGLMLFNHLLQDFLVEESILESYIENIIKSRETAVVDKTKIAQALFLYAKYGAENRQRTLVKSKELLAKTPKDIQNSIRNFLNIKPAILVYAREKELVKKWTKEKMLFGKSTDIPTPYHFPQPEANQTIYFTPYDMVQAEIRFVSRDELFNIQNIVYALLFNEYIGSGLSSVVFQEIREAKSLAYSVRASYDLGNTASDYSYLSGVLGTQPDKMKLAIDTMNHILDEFPRSQLQFDAAKTSIIKKISSKRYVNTDLFFYWLSVKDKGLNEDFNQRILSEIEHISLEDMADFYRKHISHKKQNFAVIGKREEVMPVLENLGMPIVELSNEELFNF